MPQLLHALRPLTCLDPLIKDGLTCAVVLWLNIQGIVVYSMNDNLLFLTLLLIPLPLPVRWLPTLMELREGDISDCPMVAAVYVRPIVSTSVCIMETQLLDLLDKLGYAGARDQVKTLCRSGAQKALQFLIERVHTETEACAIKDAVNTWRKQQDEASGVPCLREQLGHLGEELSRKQGRIDTLQRSLTSFQVAAVPRSGACHLRLAWRTLRAPINNAPTQIPGRAFCAPARCRRP